MSTYRESPAGLSYHSTPEEPKHHIGSCPNCGTQFYSHEPGAVCRSVGGTGHQCSGCLKDFCTECEATLIGCEAIGCQALLCIDCTHTAFHFPAGQEAQRWYFCAEHQDTDPGALILGWDRDIERLRAELAAVREGLR